MTTAIQPSDDPKPADTTVYVDITPTDSGFASMAMLLVDSIASDAKVSRRSAVQAQLAALIEVTRYLAATNIAEATRLLDFAERRARG